MVTDIFWERRQHTAFLFEVLSHMDLGKDAATLFRLPARPSSWAKSLTKGYLAAPNRLVVQFIGLCTQSLAELLGALRAPNDPRWQHTAADSKLCNALADILDQEKASFQSRWEGGACAESLEREAVVRPVLNGSLGLLRQALWSLGDREPPPLRIVDCAALGLHGRASWCRGERVVAVSLREPIEHILCQVFHEDVHAVTDRWVLAGADNPFRDTRPGCDGGDSQGYAMHRSLELVAVRTGAEVMAAAQPHFMGAYRSWCRLYGMGE